MNVSYIKKPVNIITKKIVSKDNKLNIEYPMIIGLENAEVQQSINTTIKKLVYELIKEQGYYEQHNATVEGWYEIKTNQRGILSLSIGNYTYAYHAAHGMTVVKSLTFNTENGYQYNLSDLFKSVSDYTGVLTGIISDQIKERDITLLGDFKGISPNQDFYIADKSLVIYFQLYEIAAYVYGILYFPISVYQLQDIIKPGGALELMSI